MSAAVTTLPLLALLILGITARPDPGKTQQPPSGTPPQNSGPNAGGGRPPMMPGGGDPWSQNRTHPPFGHGPTGDKKNVSRPIGGGGETPPFGRPPVNPGRGNGGQTNKTDQSPPGPQARPSPGPGSRDRFSSGVTGGPRPSPQADRVPRANALQGPQGERKKGPNGPPKGGKGPHGGKGPGPKPNGDRQFIPLFKADNVTLQNASDLHLKEGVNLFFLNKNGQPLLPVKGGPNAPQELGYGYPSNSFQPYLKLIYNPTAANAVSFEYGITTLLPSFLRAEDDED